MALATRNMRKDDLGLVLERTPAATLLANHKEGVMLIGELSRRSGLSVDTLRFYEKIGLIAPPPRDDAGRRDYGADVLGWIAFLEQLNATGMPQSERVEYAALRLQGDATLTRRREMLERHAERVEALAEKVTQTRALMVRKIDHYRKLEADYDKRS